MKLLVKIFVREYYLANSSFFLLVIAFAGGFMRSYDHLLLAEFFVSSTFVLAIPIVVWIIYAVNVVNFNLTALKQNENEFIYSFSLLPLHTQWFMLSQCLFLQLLLPIFYGIFLGLIALKYFLLPSLFVIIITLIILIVSTTFTCLRALRYPNQERKVNSFSKLLNAKVTKPFPLFFIEWIARNEPIMFLGTKIFSSLILLGTTYLYSTDKYDLRLLSFGIAVGYSANVNLVHALHRFDNYTMGWVRGLPIGTTKRVFLFLLTIITLLLPEIGILIKYFPPGFTLFELFISVIYGLSIPLLFYGILFIRERDQEEIIRLLYYLVVVWIVLILFDVPLILLSLLNISIALIFWKKYYYSFEYRSRKGEN